MTVVGLNIKKVLWNYITCKVPLDEPLSGQDVDSQQVFVDLVNKMNANGVTIIMSCHEDWL